MPELLLAHMTINGLAARPAAYGRMYRLGDIVLSNLANTLTLDAATQPFTRSYMGATNPINLELFLQTSVATSGTAPQFQLRNSGSSAGYVNQSGNTVVGNRTFVFPNAATARDSWYKPMLNDGDTAIRELDHVTVTVAATGTAVFWGFERLAPASAVLGGWGSNIDQVYDLGGIPNVAPAAATSGTPTSFDCIVLPTASNSTIAMVHGLAVGNDV